MKAPASGVDYGEFGEFYEDFFASKLTQACGMAAEGEEILVIYEAPILPHPRLEKDPRGKTVMKILTTVATSRKLGFLGVMLETVARRVARNMRRPIEVFECQIQAIKNELAGHTRADKGEMVLAARRAGIALPSGDDAMDAADSFGAWLIAVRKRAPQHRAMWDRRLFSTVGQERMSAVEARDLFRGK